MLNATAVPVKALVRQPAPSRWLHAVMSFARRKPLSAFAAVMLCIICALVIIGPEVSDTKPNVGRLRDTLLSPSLSHLAGTDEQGRDIWTRLLYGGRTSVSVGIGASLLATTFGTALGLVSGYFGGKTDIVLQRVMDAMMAIPGIIFLMVLATVLTPSLRNVTFAIAVLFTPASCRVVRSAVFAVKHESYVDAASSIGASPARVMFRHILPNVVGPVIVIASILVGGAIITEAGLGFLGLSVGPPNATWGNMLNAGAQNYMEQAPWMAVAPGVAIALTVMSVNLLGDGLRDVLDPRLRGRGR